MTRTRKTLKSLLALLVALAMTVALGVSLLASAADTMTETIVVQQSITANTTPKRTSYTYVLTPKNAENPMPAGTVDGKYTLPAIDGATTDKTAPTFTIEIDKSKAGVYEYILQKVETTPEGDKISPESHIFGYKVELNDDGEMVVIPYICQSGNPVFTDPDENGYPTKVILMNAITGTENTTKSTTTTTTKKGASSSTRTYTTARTTVKVVNGTTARARYVNTGDESQLMLWVIVLGVAVAGFLIVILLRKRNDDDDEDEETL